MRPDNTRALRRERAADTAILAARILIACALIAIGGACITGMWRDTSDRLDAVLAQARCGDACILILED